MLSSESTPLTSLASGFITKENATAAGTFATSKFHELRKQASEGDMSIRVFAALGGALVTCLSATELLGKVLTLNVIGALLDVYSCILGIVILILEGGNQIPLLPKSILVNIHKYALILRYVWGRGALYFVAGTLQMAQMGFFDLIAGGLLSSVGLIYIVVGKQTHAKLKDMKTSMMSNSALKSKFQKADSTKTGSLNLDEFTVLSASLGLDLNRREAETAFLVLDKGDKQGVITFDEFETWWHAQDDPGLFHLV